MKNSIRFYVLIAVALIGLFSFTSETVLAGVSDASKFVFRSDKTLEDRSTGLIWASDAGTPTIASCKGGKKTWHEAIQYIECLNTLTYLGYSDWRLPTSLELVGMIKADSKTPINTLLANYGFINSQGTYYWTSTSRVEGLAIAVDAQFISYEHTLNMETKCDVLPVR